MTKILRLLCLVTCMIGVARADEPSVKDLIRELNSSDIDKKEHAAQALGEMGPAAKPAIQALLDALNDELPYVRMQCAQALAKIGTPALPALIKAMKNVNAEVRSTAAAALGKWGANDEAAVSALTDALHDRELQVRGAAALALGALGVSAQSAIPALEAATKDADSSVAAKAVEALSRVNAVTIGKHEEPATVPVVTQTLPARPTPKPMKRPTPPKKKPMLVHPKVVKKVKPPPPPPVPTPEELMVQLQNGGIPISTATEQAIILRSTESTPLLIQALQGASTTTAELSAGVLEKIATEEAKKALDVYRKRQQVKKMIGLIRDLRQEGKASDDAAAALTSWGAPAVVPVSQVLSDPKPTSRRAAAKVLNQLGGASAPATTALITALDDADSDVRAQSADALKKINSTEATKALRFFSIKDKYLRLLSIFKH
jgi:HEAT repeat protein